MSDPESGTRRTKKRGRLSRHRWGPLFVLVAALLATFAVTYQYSVAIETKDRVRFRNWTLRIEHDVVRRFDTSLALLRGTSGLFAADNEVQGDEFRAYVHRLGIEENYPGTLGIGWSAAIPKARKEAFERSVRAAGQPSFRIWPAGEREFYHSIVYLEPLDRRNQAAIGYDMFTEPVRRAAMELARDTGSAAVSGRVTLVQEVDQEKQAGFLIYAPVYERGGMPTTVEERRKTLLGFVYSPLRAGDWFSAAVGAEKDSPVAFEVYDSEPNAAQLLYRSGPQQTDTPRFASTSRIEVGGRRWALAFFSTPAFDRYSDRALVPVVLVTGLMLSLLLAGITWAEARAVRLAGESTVKLRRSRRELSSQRDWLRTTLNSIGDAVIATDLTGRITYLNSRAEALSGWTMEQANGVPLQRVFNVLRADTREPQEDLIARALEVNGPTTLSAAILLARDGNERPVDDIAAPIRDANGNASGVVIVFRDVTERNRVEEARQRAAADAERVRGRLQLALTSARMAVWEWDLRQASIWESDEIAMLYGRATGWTHASYKELVASIHPEDREAFERNVADALKTCEEYHGEYRVTWPDGSVHWLSDRGKVMCDEQRQPVGMVGVTIEITEIKRAEQALRESARSKDVFVATLAHELRNPLATIGNALNVMKLAARDGKTAERMRELAERQMEQLVRLVDDLLDVSRLTEGKIKLQRARMDLVAQVQEVVEASRPALAAAGHRLTLDLPSDPLPLHADPVRISQVVNNLLSNAIKYTRQGGQIGIRVRREGEQAVVSVRDNGIGIAPEMLSHIFELYMQAHPEGEFGRTGMGIGLTLVRNLVHMHGGEVEAHSDGPGRGSEFVVRLPLATETAPSLAPSQIERRGGAEEPRRVLVVDDNVDSAESIAALLLEMGNKVEVVHDGLAAIERVRAFHPDLVLLDIGLPGIDGYETARRIRAENSEVTIAAMTGWGGDEDRRLGAAAGFNHHLLKPVGLDALTGVLAGITSPA